jgi:hypothetical protein
VVREDGWRRRVDQRSLVLDPPGWLLAELGPVPATRRSGRCGAWPLRSWTATGALTAWTTRRRRSMLGVGWPGTRGRLHRPRARPWRGTAECAGRRDAATAASVPASRCGRDVIPQLPTIATASMRAGCWAPNPAAIPLAAGATARPPGPRWRAWPTTTATAVMTVTAPRSAPAGWMAATLAVRSATVASWKEQDMRQHPDPYEDDEEDLEELGTPVYQGSGPSVRALTAEELQRSLDA